MKTIRSYSLYLFFLLFLSTSWAGNDQLSHVNSQINDIQKTLQQDTRDRKKLNNKLQEIEEKAASINKIILTNQHQLRQQQKQLQQLQIKHDNSTEHLDELQQQLSSELVSTYIANRQPYLKLLLSQQDPQHVSRTTMYYHYLYEYQQTLIDQLSQTLETLQSDKQQLANQKATLSRTIQQQTKQQAALNNTQQQRKNLIKKLNATITNKHTQLATLIQNKQQLEQTLQHIETKTTLQTKPNSHGLNRQKGLLPWPTQGQIMVNFGTKIQQSELTWSGVLIKASQGQAVHAINDGQVVFAKWLSGYGLLVIINHGQGYMSLYGRNESLYVSTGQTIHAGDLIARVGQTGGFKQPALYFAMRHNNTPLNPKLWCKLTPNTAKQGTV